MVFKCDRIQRNNMQERLLQLVISLATGVDWQPESRMRTDLLVARYVQRSLGRNKQIKVGRK